MELHRSVLPEEVLTFLAPQPGEIICDGTVGMGGHSSLIAAHIGPRGTLIGIDQDASALSIAREKLSFFHGRLFLYQGNFRRLTGILDELEVPEVNGVLLDLGASSPQFDQGERGFSYQLPGPLDMRMDTSQEITAAKIVNETNQSELASIINRYGEERWSARIAEFIVKERQKSPILTTQHLVEVIKAAVPAGARRNGPHPARRTFQALRIVVNQELEALEEGILAGIDRLSLGGRMVIISFHSLEDRIVKRVFRDKARSCRCSPDWPECRCGGDHQKVRVLTSHPVTPSSEEREANPRSRSAKLRAVCKVV